MQIIADLQLHSKYARATSPKMDLFEIARWSAKKGIDVIATGDWTHPLWFREITTHLKEVSEGLYSLKKPASDQDREVKFLLSTEISSIYSQNGRGYRVHNLIFSPSIEVCKKIIAELMRRGAKLMSDGRPIVGISSHDLLELILTIDENCLLIPAHAWTPWFALYGSKSGFDSIDDCFLELSKHIYAIETGLSSDPRMNWQVKELDNRSILSFSDAHSGPKLGREATVFTCNMKHEACNISYADIVAAIRQKPKSHLKIGYTIEFFPEEGKYHYSGHRVCNIRMSPQEVKKNGKICPVCKREMTIGVENRVLDLSTRDIAETDVLHKQNKNGLTFVGDREGKRRPFVSLIPLLEILLHLTGSPTGATRLYDSALNNLGTEFDILMSLPIEQIQSRQGPELANAIAKLRRREVSIEPGYDGVFGKIAIDISEPKEKNEKQDLLF